MIGNIVDARVGSHWGIVLHGIVEDCFETEFGKSM